MRFSCVKTCRSTVHTWPKKRLPSWCRSPLWRGFQILQASSTSPVSSRTSFFVEGTTLVGASACSCGRGHFLQHFLQPFFWQSSSRDDGNSRQKLLASARQVFGARYIYWANKSETSHFYPINISGSRPTWLQCLKLRRKAQLAYFALCYFFHTFPFQACSCESNVASDQT